MFEAGVIVAVFALAFFFLGYTNFPDYIFVIIAGAAGIAGYYFYFLRQFFGRASRQLLSEQLSQGRLFFISTLLGTIFMSSDRLLVGKFLDLRTLGIYSAYYLASFTLVAQGTQLFTNVFFPATARLENKAFAKKIDRLMILGFLPIALVIGALIILMLLIFGKDYPMSPIYITGFSVLSASYFFFSLYNTVLLDASKSVYKRYLIVMNIVNFSIVAALVVASFVGIFSVTATLVALIINYLTMILIQRRFIEQMRRD